MDAGMAHSQNSSQGESLLPVDVVFLGSVPSCSTSALGGFTLLTASLTAFGFGVIHWHLIARVVLATHKENLDMNTSKLIELKLAVIQYHTGDNMDYLQRGIARDACYTSYNSLGYKRKQMADTIADFESAVVEQKDTLADRLVARIEGMERELEELIERHEADKAVYELICDGQEWYPEAKKRPTITNDMTKRMAALKAKVAA
jgi:hypothetical protein